MSHQLRFVVVVAAVIALLQASAPFASAADQSFHEAYSFALTPAQCPELDSTISGAGEYFIRINTRTDKNGVTHSVINLTTSGTATDENGGVYRYNYHNHHNAKAQPGGFPSTERITDHFNLVGAGGRNSLHVGFTIVLTFAAPGQDPTVEEISVRGFPPCDPI